MEEVRPRLLGLVAEVVVVHEQITSESNGRVVLDRARVGERSLGTHLSRKTLGVKLYPR